MKECFITKENAFYRVLMSHLFNYTMELKKTHYPHKKPSVCREDQGFKVLSRPCHKLVITASRHSDKLSIGMT